MDITEAHRSQILKRPSLAKYGTVLRIKINKDSSSLNKIGIYESILLLTR